jgi:hypothetical protein
MSSNHGAWQVFVTMTHPSKTEYEQGTAANILDRYHQDLFLIFAGCVIMQSVFSAAARRTTSPERFARGRAAPVR